MMHLWEDLTLLRKILLDENEAIHEWEKYYEMNSNTVDLIKQLVTERKKSFFNPIFLNKWQKKMISSDKICSECRESLGELHIYIRE